MAGADRPSHDERGRYDAESRHSAVDPIVSAAATRLDWVQTGAMEQRVRLRVRVTGVVQGVGFRPFVYGLATRLGLAGFVGNDVHGVFAEIEGAVTAVERFVHALEAEPPPLAAVDEVHSTVVPVRAEPGFRIVESTDAGHRDTLIAADSATCADCLAELADPTDRRFGYAFTNCTNCGPRFTIVTGIPYDRPSTTMAGFALCPRCAREYHDPADRRFHAQPVCCPDCGPRLRLVDAAGQESGADPVAGAAALLREGGVLAVKGLGGYHLATDARAERACAALRSRKHREDKAFAVMVADVDAARELCRLERAEEPVLTSRRRPIVLLPRRPDAVVAASVAPRNRELGVMLPYTPLHHLLLGIFGGPIVLTSGNVSDEPIAYRDEDAIERLAPIADGFLMHDRPIHTRTDDSVVRPDPTGRGAECVIRRSRGYVPEPLRVAAGFPRAVLACGAELKNTFCLAQGSRAFISHHIGDLENLETLRSFTEGIEQFGRLFEITPEVVAFDLHPEYLSTKHARTLNGLATVGVQHHHAHIASCLADNERTESVIGVAFDGTGFGTDGTIWGGEFLLADLLGFDRAGLLSPVPMPGGAAAIRHPWRMALAHLDAAFDGAVPEKLGLHDRHEQEWDAVLTMLRRGFNSPRTSSAGRLFDAVAAILGVRDSVHYEGQAAVELEQLADRREHDAYPVTIGTAEPFQLDTGGLIRAVTEDHLSGTPVEVSAARFHHGLASAIASGCALIRERTGHETVALSGGVFANTLLTGACLHRLREQGFTVLTQARVPCNDGGISFGQAVIAGARDRAGTLAPTP